MLENKIDRIERNVKKVEQEQESIAMSVLKERSIADKRKDIIFVIVSVLLIISNIISWGMVVYLLNDIGVEETIEETYDMSTDDGNNNYVGGDNNGEINNN